MQFRSLFGKFTIGRSTVGIAPRDRRAERTRDCPGRRLKAGTDCEL